ncbi:hypothetical protein T439DRAFT_321035 [Meredithblackwellia eburnea MCA 4105]
MGQCISLSGSAMCPSYQSLSINPQNLSTVYPFLSGVTDAASFDSALAKYLQPGGEFARVKQKLELGCNNYGANFILQYQRSFLCGLFTTLPESASCNPNISSSNLMTCQSTCQAFAASEQGLVNNTGICPTTSPYRAGNMTQDFTQCTSWTSLSTANTATCIQGSTNEPNCGFASSTSQLCSNCDPSGGRLVDSCCIGSTTDISSCGYTLTAANIIGYNATASTTSGAPTSTSSSALATGGTAAARSKKSLSGGSIAAIVLGILFGLLLLLALIGLCLYRRRRNRSSSLQETTTTATQPNPRSDGGEFGSLATFHDSKARIAGGASGTSFGAHSDKASPAFEYVKSAPFIAAAAALGGGAAAEEKEREHNENRMSNMTGLTGLTYETQETEDSNGGRNLVAEFQDLYSPVIIKPETDVEALYAYQPALPDELQLSPGDQIFVTKLYDDNWAQGTIHDEDGDVRTGAFPLVCVTGAIGGDTEHSYDGNSSSAGRTRRTTTDGSAGNGTGNGSSNNNTTTNNNNNGLSAAVSDRSSSYSGGADAAQRDRLIMANNSNLVFPSRRRNSPPEVPPLPSPPSPEYTTHA